MKHYYIIFLLFFSCMGLQAQDKITSDTFGSSSLSENIMLYPNPTTSGRFTIQTENYDTKEIEIFDLVGNKIITFVFNGKEKEFSSAKLKTGIYIIKIKTKGTSISRKLVIK